MSGLIAREIATPGANDQVLVACADHERMPARPAARFKGDEILVAQLVDDLPSRDAALRRRTRHERVAAGPLREIRERAAKRGPRDRIRRGVFSRVVNRRHDAEDVHRHVDLARDRGDVRRRHATGGIGAVGQHDDRSPASVALTRAARGPRDRVVQRSRTERHEAADRVG